MSFLSPQRFLWITGAGLLGLGLAGFVLPAIGVDATHRYFTLSAGENVAHMAAGLFAAVVALLLRSRPKSLKWLVVLMGIAALFFGIYGFLGEWAERGSASSLSFLDAWAVSDLAGPYDNLFHVLYAAWALVAAFRTSPVPVDAGAGNLDEDKPRPVFGR
ncbi:MAG: hypothetical protein HYY34_07275 [Chloroflexi bacterium]|nr:hypothetical protein [Chloroflexota bacterium]